MKALFVFNTLLCSTYTSEYWLVKLNYMGTSRFPMTLSVFFFILLLWLSGPQIGGSQFDFRVWHHVVEFYHQKFRNLAHRIKSANVRVMLNENKYISQ